MKKTNPLSEAAAALGRLGGRKKTPAKSAASRENGRKGGRPRKSWKASEWTENEVADLMDAYDNDDRRDQLQFVLDKLRSDEYRDELSDDQSAAAAAYIVQTLKGGK